MRFQAQIPPWYLPLVMLFAQLAACCDCSDTLLKATDALWDVGP